MPFNPRSLKNLKRIVKATDAKIVLTSSWRNSPNGMVVLEARLMEYGMKIFSQTDYIEGYRGQEIKKWIDTNDNNCEILILDDEMYDIKDYYDDKYIVRTNWCKGLTYLKTIEAIRKIKRQIKE